MGSRLLAKSESCQMREWPAGARFVPFISTHVLAAMTGASPSAFATTVIVGTRGGVTPVGMRPILPANSTNHMAPSGPAAIEQPRRPLAVYVGVATSAVTEPDVVI